MFFKELNAASCKSYFVGCEETHAAALIDPLFERVDHYLAFLKEHRYELQLVIDTHTHADHKTGSWELRARTGARTLMHKRAPAPDIDIHVEEGDRLNVGRLQFEVLATPGHSSDAISLYLGGCVLTGDSLLVQGCGRTDLPNGDSGVAYDSIQKKLFALPDATLVFPGHDYKGREHSTIGEEKRTNPRLAGRTREDFIHLMGGLRIPLPDRIQEALQANQSAIEDGSVQFPALSKLGEVPQLSPLELQARLSASAGCLVVDVRQKDEYVGELGHIPGSRLLPLPELPARTDELSSQKTRPLVCVCRSGARSTSAAAILLGLGFEQVWNLRGGMLAWNEEKLPVIR